MSDPGKDSHNVTSKSPAENMDVQQESQSINQSIHQAISQTTLQMEQSHTILFTDLQNSVKTQ